MNLEIDYYDILGVLPTAEEIVIKAAYKALSQKYHPDKCLERDAELKMAAINEAYSILSNFEKRNIYDRQRKHSEDSRSTDFEDVDSFCGAPNDWDDDWAVACKYFPEIAQFESDLSKLSLRLRNSFKIYLLETKEFSKAKKVADRVETEFLDYYFGNKSKIRDFGKRLLLAKKFAAAKSLNTVVNILGNSADPDKVINQIVMDFDPFGELAKAQAYKESQELAEKERINNVANWLRTQTINLSEAEIHKIISLTRHITRFRYPISTSNIPEKTALLELLGGKLVARKGGMFKPTERFAYLPNEDKPLTMVQLDAWICEILAPTIL